MHPAVAKETRVYTTHIIALWLPLTTHIALWLPLDIHIALWLPTASLYGLYCS